MSEPISVSEAAVFLRLDGTSPIPDEALITSIITAARLAAENYLNRTIMERSRVLTLDFFTTVIELPYGDVSDIVSIEYVDTDGADQTVAEYVLSENRLTAAYGEEWPSTRAQLGAVTITYTAGYTAVPENITQAMYLMIADMYDVRNPVIVGSSIAESPTLVNLLIPDRVDMGV